jgi:Leucine-rich repeat (LRR) protein
LAGRQLKDLPPFPWEKLENLRVLDLEGNNLDIIPVSIAFLAQLERVLLDGNPMRTVPERFRSPWPVLREYMKSIGNKAAHWTEKKLLFVGQEGVGKSTLLKSLRSRRHKVSCKENLSTGKPTLCVPSCAFSMLWECYWDGRI